MNELTNSFHGTRCRSRLTEADLRDTEAVLMTGRVGSQELKRAQAVARRLWKRLCGVKGCTCGDTFGRR